MEATSPNTNPTPETTLSENAAQDAANQEATSADALPVTLTPKAVDMVVITREQEKIDDAYGLRVAVRGGGCSGFEYALDFEEAPRPNDLSYQQGKLTVFVDPVSARYLDGTQIDYVLGTTGAGFKFNNPKAVGTCGCGSSFAV